MSFVYQRNSAISLKIVEYTLQIKHFYYWKSLEILFYTLFTPPSFDFIPPTENSDRISVLACLLNWELRTFSCAPVHFYDHVITFKQSFFKPIQLWRDKCLNIQVILMHTCIEGHKQCIYYFFFSSFCSYDVQWTVGNIVGICFHCVRN